MTTNDDDVGYKRPPIKNRWQPGQSGNPSGKKRKAPTMVELLEKELRSKVVVRDAQSGSTERRTTKEQLARIIRNKALKGELKWVELLMRIDHANATDHNLADDDFSKDDEAIIEAFKNSLKVEEVETDQLHSENTSSCGFDPAQIKKDEANE